MSKLEVFKKQTSQRPKVEYVYYSPPDDLFKRLELLCAQRDIRNDSVEVRNEIVSILDLLLKQNAITLKEHKISCIINGVINLELR
jgi:hypothetical protein